jgi:SAM-dependent methyltransferase
MSADPAQLASPSAWVQRFATLIPAGGRVLDVACGAGRHARLLAQLGFQVTAVDRDADAIAALAMLPGIEARVADLERGEWPYAGQTFAGVIVTNYLHRPLFPLLIDCIADGGVLIYETFARGNERFGRPSNPAFLLEPGELLRVVAGRLRVLAYEDLLIEEPRPAMVQRICAADSRIYLKIPHARVDV